LQEAAGNEAKAGVLTVVKVHKVRFKDGSAGRTDGVDIWIDDRLNEIEQRCVIMHELIHIERGEGTCQPEYVEMEVRYETARRLLPLEVIAGVCKDGKDLASIAAELRVTRRVLMDRAVTLTKEQAAQAGCFTCLKCPSQAARMRELLGALVDNERHPRMVRAVAVAA